ncbi:MAG: nucleotidyltransferase family protein [Pyrinomonadaceae bacterium]
MKTNAAKETGRLIATFLTGAWRPEPPALDFSATDFERIAPLLLQTGAGALGWWRLRESELRSCGAAEQMHEALRLYTLESRLNKSKIEEVFALLRSCGIEPILIKGWAAARYYPERGLRPYGDIDICVRPEEFQSAERALAGLDPRRFRMDLHSGFAKFGIREEEEELITRSQLACIDQTEVRILGAEDHLRVVCFHLMREGAWRPLWLADVAAALESLPKDFDWNYCLGEKRQAAPLVNAINLAQLLLGAKVDGIPEEKRANKTPRWLVPTILNEWGSPAPSMMSRHDFPMLGHLQLRKELLNGLRHRWPNAIEATTTMNGPFNDWPRLPFQIGNSLFRVGAFLTHLPKTWNK